MNNNSYKTNIYGSTTIDKDPNATLDYSWYWTAWLAAITDTINSVIITSVGVTVVSHNQTNGMITVWVSGGNVGFLATVTCKIVTVGGRTDERTITFNMVPR